VLGVFCFVFLAVFPAAELVFVAATGDQLLANTMEFWQLYLFVVPMRADAAVGQDMHQ